MDLMGSLASIKAKLTALHSHNRHLLKFPLLGLDGASVQSASVKDLCGRKHMPPESSQRAFTIPPVLNYAPDWCMIVCMEGWIRGKQVRYPAQNLEN
jgi:hypothetical protein